MTLKSRVLEQIKRISLWGEREIRMGPLAFLACDLSLSVTVMRRRDKIEMNMLALDWREGDPPIPIEVPSYGVVVEPFLLSLMGSDGDVSWQSPGWDLTTWLCIAAAEPTEWVNFGDLLVDECHIQGRHGVDYIFGDHDCPCLGKGLRFRDPTKSFCGESEFVPQEGDGHVDYWQLVDNCHDVEIHRDDAREFTQRVNQYRASLGY